MEVFDLEHQMCLGMQGILQHNDTSQENLVLRIEGVEFPGSSKYETSHCQPTLSLHWMSPPMRPAFEMCHMQLAYNQCVQCSPLPLC